MTIKKAKDRVDALIDKGAAVKADKLPENAFSYISLRIPTALLREIDQRVTDKCGMTRTWWILEALRQRLERGE